MDKKFTDFRDSYIRALSGTDTNLPWEKRKDMALSTAAKQTFEDAPQLLKQFGTALGKKTPRDEWSDEAVEGQMVALSMAQAMRRYNKSLTGKLAERVLRKEETVERGKHKHPDSAKQRFFVLCGQFDKLPEDDFLAYVLGIRESSLSPYRTAASRLGFAFTHIEGGWKVAKAEKTDTITQSDLDALREIAGKFGYKLV